MLKILKSSKAAMDLASIMIGVVVIGVIGGVIAATIFGIIPWVHDQVAKRQVTEIASAQNSYAGLSIADVSGLNALSMAGGMRPAEIVEVPDHPFGNLRQLVDDGLITIAVKDGSDIMNAAGNMCSVAVDGGANYRTEVKSETGSLFVSTNVTNTPQPLAAKDSYCFGSPTTKEIVNITDCNSQCNYYTRLTGDGLSVVIQDITITSDKTTPMDWEIRYSKKTTPLNLIGDADVNAPMYLTDSRLGSKIEGDYIIIYNTDPSARIKEGVPFTVKEASYRYTAPTHPALTTKNSGAINLNKAGDTVWADLNVEMANPNEQTFGKWETDFDITGMKNLMGQNGTLSLNSGWADHGFTVTQKSGNIYTLKYNPTTNLSFVLKGKATPQNFNNGVVNMGSALKFTGDGKTEATVTSAGSPSGNQWYATQKFNITVKAQGAWGPVEVNLQDLRNLNRSKRVVVNDSNFSITPKQGDSSGNLYLISFKGTWQSPSQVEIALN